MENINHEAQQKLLAAMTHAITVETALEDALSILLLPLKIRHGYATGQPQWKVAWVERYHGTGICAAIRPPAFGPIPIARFAELKSMLGCDELRADAFAVGHIQYIAFWEVA